MNIISKNETLHVIKPEGTDVSYYLRNEYELHYNEQAPGTTQKWHHHEHILEALFLLSGELTAEWKIDGEIKKQVIKPGDLVESERSPHTFYNHTDAITKFIVIKLVPTGENKKELLKTDKVLD